MREAYLKCFLSALQLRLVSKPIVSSRTYRQFSFVFSNRSGLKLSPVMMDGEGKPGTSAKIDDPSIAFKEVAKNLAQTYVARCNDLVLDTLCKPLQREIKFRNLDRIDNQKFDLNSIG